VRPGGPPQLFRHIYLHGLLLLGAVGILVFVVGTLLGRRVLWREYPEHLARHLAEQLGPLRDRPEMLSREIRRMSRTLKVDIVLYRADGTIGGASSESALNPLDPLDQGRLAMGPIHVRDRSSHGLVAVAVGGGDYLEMSLPSFAVRALLRAMGIVGILLVALGVTSFPLARAITRPLERLTETARRLGHGDLTIRSGIRRADEIGELATAFDEMADRLQRLVQGERELLANVSHEFRTPMARMRVALDLAAEGDREGARRYLTEISADLDELERLVEDILTAARLDSGMTPPLRLALVDPEALIEQAAARFRPTYPRRTLEIKASACPPIMADPALLRRVIDNLLDNAAKYSDAGPIVVSVAKGAGGVVFEVVDQGIGVDPGDLPKLFNPFFRTDRSRARQTGGVGLGLALAKRIVEAHGGAITIESSPGKGTAVRFTVPKAPTGELYSA
jgi:two-component system OmpR family sensor kinase